MASHGAPFAFQLIKRIPRRLRRGMNSKVRTNQLELTLPTSLVCFKRGRRICEEKLGMHVLPLFRVRERGCREATGVSVKHLIPRSLLRGSSFHKRNNSL